MLEVAAKLVQYGDVDMESSKIIKCTGIYEFRYMYSV